MREIVLDTETTGLSPASGHRLVDVGCVELIDGLPSGITFQRYINPQREVPAEAMAVHGLSTDFLKNHPPFEHVVHEFLAFVADATLVIHNAKFDLAFLNAELGWLKMAPLSNTVVDTVQLARQKYPGSPANLDALCKRLNIDLSTRTKHGAMVDAWLLAKIYPVLREKNILQWTQTRVTHVKKTRPMRPLRVFSLSTEEEQAYQDMMTTRD